MGGTGIATGLMDMFGGMADIPFRVGAALGYQGATTPLIDQAQDTAMADRTRMGESFGQLDASSQGYGDWMAGERASGTWSRGSIATTPEEARLRQERGASGGLAEEIYTPLGDAYRRQEAGMIETQEMVDRTVAEGAATITETTTRVDEALSKLSLSAANEIAGVSASYEETLRNMNASPTYTDPATGKTVPRTAGTDRATRLQANRMVGDAANRIKERTNKEWSAYNLQGTQIIKNSRQFASQQNLTARATAINQRTTDAKAVLDVGMWTQEDERASQEFHAGLVSRNAATRAQIAGMMNTVSMNAIRFEADIHGNVANLWIGVGTSLSESLSSFSTIAENEINIRNA
jgi:hypothetical protein